MLRLKLQSAALVWAAQPFRTGDCSEKQAT